MNASRSLLLVGALAAAALPLLAGFFSRNESAPAALIAAERSAFNAMKRSHAAGTWTSGKIAATGHSGKHASQSMQFCGSM